MKGNPVILSYDIITPLGYDCETSWENAQLGKCGIKKLTRQQNISPLIPPFAGEIPEIDLSPYSFLSAKENTLWFTPAITYSQVVAYRTLQKVGLLVQGKLPPHLASRMAVTFSTTLGGVEAMITAQYKKTKEQKSPHPFTNPNGCLNMVAGKISILTGAKGPIFSPMAGQATGAISVINGVMLLRQGLADLVLCGSVEFPLFEPYLSSYVGHGLYSGNESEPSLIMSPFGKDRRGFVLSEGCGCLLIGTQEMAKELGLRPLIEVVSSTMRNDVLDGFKNDDFNKKVEMRAKVIHECLDKGRVKPSDVHLISASANSTILPDQWEREAIQEVFGQSKAILMAPKSQLGHALGAASSLEMILGFISLEKQTALPILNFKYEDDRSHYPLILAKAETQTMENFLMNSFENEGTLTSLLFRKSF